MVVKHHVAVHLGDEGLPSERPDGGDAMIAVGQDLCDAVGDKELCIYSQKVSKVKKKKKKQI